MYLISTLQPYDTVKEYKSTNIQEMKNSIMSLFLKSKKSKLNECILQFLSDMSV